MKIFYNLSVAACKALVTAITEELNMPAHYHSAPTFAYKVGGYQIDKTGMLEGTDNRGLVADLLGLHDFKAIQEEYDMVPQAEEPVPDDLTITETTALGGQISPYDDEQEPDAYAQPESDTMVIEVPLTGFTPDKLDNLIKLVNRRKTCSEQPLGLITYRFSKPPIHSGFHGFPWRLVHRITATRSKPTPCWLKRCARL